MNRRAGACFVLLMLAAVSCERAPKPTPPWRQETGYRWRDLDVPAGEPGFTRMDGRKTGIRFQNTVSD